MDNILKSFTSPARIDQLDNVMAFIAHALTTYDCPMKMQHKISIAVEEIFVNISNYAYHPGEGDATIHCLIENGEMLGITIQFLDKGMAYNPLEKPDTDTTLLVDEREIGGLGILIVKKIMDDIQYEYKNGTNILTIKKSL